MSEGRTNNDDYISDCYLGAWEEQIIDELENESDNLNQRLQYETEAATKKLWTSFQNAAQFVAVMYKGAADNQHTLWIPFQTAAGSVTSLYKESLEFMRKSSELGIQSGYQKRTKEVANWARRKRHIRREELLAFLSGKSPPPARNTHLRGSPRARLSVDRMSPRNPTSHQTHHNAQLTDDDLTTFREALGIHAPIAASNFSSRRRNSGHSPELQTFICDEFARHKRPASSASPTHDVTMDSPQHKRFKFV